MKTRMIMLLMISFLGLLAFRPPEGQKPKSYQGWINWISGATDKDTTHVATPEELADIVSAINNGQIDADTTYILSTGIKFKMAHPKEYLETIIMCVKSGEPDIKTTQDVIDAIARGEVVRWDNNISGKVKNYYFSSKANEVRFVGNYSGAEKEIQILLINGKPKVKMEDCINPLQPYEDDYTPNYTKGVPVSDTVYVTVDENGKTKTDTIWAILLLEEKECPPLWRTTYCYRPCYDCYPSYSYDWSQPLLSFSFNFSFGAPNYCGYGEYGYGSYGGYHGCNRYYNSGGTYIDNSVTYIDNSYYNYEDNDVVNNYYPKTKPPNGGSGIDPQIPPDPEPGGPGIDPQGGGEKSGGIKKGGELAKNKIPSSSPKTTTVPGQKINGKIAPYQAAPQTKDLAISSTKKPNPNAGDIASASKIASQQPGGTLVRDVPKSRPTTSDGGSLTKVAPVNGTTHVIPSSAKSAKPVESLTRSTPTTPAGKNLIPSVTRQGSSGGELTKVSPTGGTATRTIGTSAKSLNSGDLATARTAPTGGDATRKTYTKPSTSKQGGSGRTYTKPSTSKQTGPNRAYTKPTTSKQSNPNRTYTKPSVSYNSGSGSRYDGTPSKGRSYSGGSATRSGSYSGGGASRSTGNSGGGASRSSGGSSPRSMVNHGGGMKPR